MVCRKCVLCPGCWPAVHSVHTLPLIKVHAQSSLQRGVPYMNGSPSSLTSTTRAKGMVMHLKKCCTVRPCMQCGSSLLTEGNLDTQIAHLPGMQLRTCTEHKHPLCAICTPTHHRKEFHRRPAHLHHTPQCHKYMPETFAHSHAIHTKCNVVENQFHMQKVGYFLMF